MKMLVIFVFSRLEIFCFIWATALSPVSSLSLVILLRGHLAAIFSEMPGRFWAICGELGTNGALPAKKQTSSSYELCFDTRFACVPCIAFSDEMILED